MKTEQEIKDKIKDLENEKLGWVKRQKDFTWTDETRKNGSRSYGVLQENGTQCNREINTLEWVLRATNGEIITSTGNAHDSLKAENEKMLEGLKNIIEETKNTMLKMGPLLKDAIEEGESIISQIENK